MQFGRRLSVHDEAILRASQVLLAGRDFQFESAGAGLPIFGGGTHHL